MRTVRVAAAIIVQEERVLAAQRGYGEFAGGWEFPGGKIEPGETPEGACVREAREELGVEVCDLVPFHTVEHDYPDAEHPFHLTMHCFLCRKAPGPLRDSEHASLRWLAPHELTSVAWLPADIELVEKLKMHLETGDAAKLASETDNAAEQGRAKASAAHGSGYPTGADSPAEPECAAEPESEERP